jgi:hypothetical protein
MKVAGDQSTGDRDSVSPGAEEPLVSLYRASQLTGVKHATLFKWVRNGTLKPRATAPRGRRTVYYVTIDDVAVTRAAKDARAAAIDSAVGEYKSGRTAVELARELECSPQTIANHVHAAGLEMRHGAPTKHPAPEPRECKNPKCRAVFTPAYPAWAAKAHRSLYCSRTCLVAGRWQLGIGVRTLLDLRSGPERRRYWKGLWGSRKPPAPGARPRGRPRKDVAPELVELVESYAAREWGYRTIAAAADVAAAGGTVRVVRAILRDYQRREQARQPTLFVRT